jgi:hypothetical protein
MLFCRDEVGRGHRAPADRDQGYWELNPASSGQESVVDARDADAPGHLHLTLIAERGRPACKSRANNRLYMVGCEIEFRPIGNRPDRIIGVRSPARSARLSVMPGSAAGMAAYYTSHLRVSRSPGMVVAAAGRSWRIFEEASDARAVRPTIVTRHPRCKPLSCADALAVRAAHCTCWSPRRSCRRAWRNW